MPPPRRQALPFRSNADTEAEESDTDDWAISSTNPGMDHGPNKAASYRDGTAHIGSTVTGRTVTPDCYMAVTADRYFAVTGTMPRRWRCFGGGWDSGKGECRGQCKDAQ